MHILKKTLAASIFSVMAALPFSAFAAAEVGQQAVAFTGKTAEGKTIQLSDYKGKITVLEWTNPNCPFVRKYYDDQAMQNLQKDYKAKGVAWLTINSTAKGKDGFLEGDALSANLKQEKLIPANYVLDTDGKIGKSYGAKTTPHLFVIDKEGKVAYAGAIDSIASTDPADIAKAEPYVKEALDAVIAGKPVEKATTKSYGCSVKYAD